MWRIIIVAVLLGAVAGLKTPSDAFVKPIEKTKDDSPITTTTATALSNSSPILSTTTTTTTRTPPLESSSSSKPTSSPFPQAVSTIPSQETNSDLPPAFIPIDDNDSNIEPNKRRIITYDQRQEGQYNIRADLENFMIVLIPPSPMEGINLLDLLTKSSLRRSAATHSNKVKRRHPYADVAAAQTASAATRFHQSLKTGNNNQNFNYFNRAEGVTAKDVNTPETAHRRYHQHQQQQHQQQPGDDSPHSSSTRFQEFIEGRTPYLVDLSSSSNSEHTRLHPDRQVDVLPPPYPLAYQHLITPFHLEAEPTVIQTLPPSSIAGQSSQGASNFLETYNQLLATSLQEGNEDAPNAHVKTPQESDFYRVSRDIRGDNMLDTNGVTLSNSLLSGSPDASMSRRFSNLPIFRSDLSFGTAALYPPIDAPRLTGYLNVGSNSRTLSLNSAEERDFDDAHVGEIIMPSPNGDELDFDLNSASFIDSEAKSLLSDGLERCAPGRRRDSYGVCREIEGY